MSTIGTLVRKLVPRPARVVAANCGGRNLRGSRFAGRLADGQLSDDEFLAICHSLIFPNGVRKTTSPARNTATLEKVLASVELAPELDVLEVGASIGVDAKATFDLLSSRAAVRSYTLGDLYPAVLYDRERRAVFDDERNLLQVKDRLGFTSIHFAYDETARRAQKLVHVPKRVRPWLLSRRIAYRDGAAVTRIPLVHPSIRLGGDSPFRLEKIDVFGHIPGAYDLVVCMHLLVSRYWSAETIARGERNLARTLRVGGTLVVGAAEEGRVWRRVSDDDFDVQPYASS